MQVCPAGHFSKDPDVCDVCGLTLHTGPQQGDDGLDVDTAAARTRPVAVDPPASSQAATTVMPSGPAPDASSPDGASQAATTAIPVTPDSSQAATTAIPVEEVRSAHAGATVLPDQPGSSTTVMPAGNPAATSIMPVTEPEPPAPLAPIEPATPAVRHTSPAAEQSGAAGYGGYGGYDEGAAVPPTGATALLGKGRTAHWHAVLTVDAAWYAVQDTPYQMPPEGRSTVVELTSDSAMLGRRSRSRGTTPDIDCSTDPGVSRRHAQFDLIDGRWYVEDLGSANGTYIAPAGAPLPEHPISVGRRVEVGPGDTVYLGAWTRLSIADDDAWQV